MVTIYVFEKAINSTDIILLKNLTEQSGTKINFHSNKKGVFLDVKTKFLKDIDESNGLE